MKLPFRRKKTVPQRIMGGLEKSVHMIMLAFTKSGRALLRFERGSGKQIQSAERS